MLVGVLTWRAVAVSLCPRREHGLVQAVGAAAALVLAAEREPEQAQQPWHDATNSCTIVVKQPTASPLQLQVDLLLNVHRGVAPAHGVHLVLQHLPLGRRQAASKGDTKGAHLHLVW